MEKRLRWYWKRPGTPRRPSASSPKPLKINTDKAPTHGPAIADLKKEGKLQQLLKPVRGFKSLKTAYATIKGFEVMHALRKGQAAIFQYGGIMGEVRLIERQFGLYTY